VSNGIYLNGRKHFLQGDVAWLTDNIKAVLIDTAIYTRDLTNDEFLTAIASGARIATSGNLASKTSTAGTADAADITWTAVSGAQASQIGVYKDTGTAGTSALLVNYDTATNLPVTPNGGDIQCQWDNGTNKMFTLMEGLSPETCRDLVGELSRAAWRELRDRVHRWLKGLGVPAEFDRPMGRIWIPAPRVIIQPS